MWLNWSRIWWLAWTCLLTVPASLGVQQITNPRIIEHPTDQYVAKNEPVTLNCKAEGDPQPIITWYRNGQPVITSTENQSSNRLLLPSGKLFFLRVIHNKNQKPDVGVYYCNATNPETKVSVLSRNATLEIAVLRTDFRAHPQNKEVAVGERAELVCQGPRGLPEPRIKWKKDGQTIHANRRIRIQDQGTLVLDNAEKADSGMYVCIAQNLAGEKESNPARLSVQEKPKFEEAPVDIQVEENKDVQFKCKASGDPQPTIIWKKEDGQINPERSEILRDRSLKIKRVQVSDEGRYICRAENNVGHVESIARLSVQSQPSFIMTPKDKVVGVGRRVSMQCEVTGNPPPAVFWNKDDSQILMFPRQDHDRFSVTEEGTLVIEPVRKEDAGNYVCQAFSVAGSSYAKAKLEVKDVDPRPPPIIHQGPQNQTLPVDSVAMLQCSSTGDPPPTIRWLRNDRILTLRDARYTVLDSGTLQISGLRKTDTGMYTCKAISETGETSWSAALRVESEKNQSVIFHRTPEPSTFPGSPSRPSVSEISETSMKLMWKANPNHGASPVQSYTVEYFSHETGDGWVVAADNIRSQSYVVRRLRPDTAYMFLVRAQNSHGLSLPSQVTQPMRTRGGSGARPTLPPYDISEVSARLTGQVVVLKETEVISSTAIKIRWEVKKSHRFIEGFHIKYRVVPDIQEHLEHRHHHHHIEYTIETVTSPTATMYMLRDLQEFTEYEIRIQPFFLTVEGQESNILRNKTLQDLPSSPPQNLASNLFDNGTLHLTWSPPPHDKLNGPLLGYTVFIYTNNSRNPRIVKTNTTSILIPQMFKGSKYRVQVAASNEKGSSVESDPIMIGGGKERMRGFLNEPWFIATLIGTIGGTLWFALCVFSIWLYRKWKNKKKLRKSGGCVNVPVHKSDDQNRAGHLFHSLNAPNYLQKDIANHAADSGRPDVANVGNQIRPEKENLYNTPNISAPMRTFYNKNNPANVAPYATTTLVNSLMQGQHTPESAFRPIHGGYTPQPHGSGSSDSCLKHELLNSSDTSNNAEMPLLEPCQQCEHAVTSPMSDCGSQTADEDGMGHGYTPKQPLLFLPPPPDHPPPSDIGTPPDSPTQIRAPASRFCDRQQHCMGSPRTVSSDHGGHTPRPRNHMDHMGIHHPSNQDPSNRCRTMSPRTHGEPRNVNDSRAYSPRAMSEPERGPTPPVRAYKLVPIRDNELHRHYSDTEGAPVPPLRMLVPHTPPSPAPDDPMMDRGIQSSLPSLVNELPHRMAHNPEGYPLLGADPYHRHQEAESPVSEMEGIHDYPCESDMEVTGGRDCHTPESSIADVDTVTGSMMASWASDVSDTNCSSVRSSAASSSDGSFLAEADFASAVAKAAELSGLTVVGSTVSDPNAGREREKVKRYKHRERAKRPTSPYSTDSNYSAIQLPRNPYPKSDRKRQLKEHNGVSSRHNNSSDSGHGGDRRPRPPVKAKPQIPQHLADMPSYNKPMGPSVTNNNAVRSRGGPRSPSHPTGGESDASVRTNPLAAFDTRDTPIV